MPRIILLSHDFQPEYEAGFANGLARNGWSVTLIGSDRSLVDRLDSGVNLLNLYGRRRWRKVLPMLRCYGYVLRHRGTPVHMIGAFSTDDLRVSLIEAWLTRLLVGRYVMTVHNLLPHDQHSARNFRLSRAIYRAAAVCMVHTRRMRDALADEFGIDPARIVVVEHGIDRLLPPTEESRRAMRIRLGVNEDDKLLLFFGNLALYKGVDVLLQAFDRLAGNLPVRLVIAGRCHDPSLKAALRKQIDVSAYRASVHWLEGYFPENEVASLFHAADVLVMPYRHIDQSGVVFMALATGLRVVASDVGSLRDYIPPGFGCVVLPGDADALAEGIVTVLTQPQRSEVQEKLAAHHLWSSVVQPILPVYAWIRGGSDFAPPLKMSSERSV